MRRVDLVVMTSSGDSPEALNEGGRWEHSPAWSPDGQRIAFHTIDGDTHTVSITRND